MWHFLEKPLAGSPWFWNAPTCYGAPRWPDTEFPRQIPKKYPPEILDSQNLPWKPPENTEKIPQNTKDARFGYFLGVFLGVLSVFLVEIPGRAISGSVAGRGVLNPWFLFPPYCFTGTEPAWPSTEVSGKTVTPWEARRKALPQGRASHLGGTILLGAKKNQ